jgi:hypothetical protein
VRLLPNKALKTDGRFAPAAERQIVGRTNMVQQSRTRSTVRFLLAATIVASIAVGLEARAAPPRVVISEPKLGIMNVMGSKALALIGEDQKAFPPLFGKPLESTKGPPKCDVLLLYAHLDESGKVSRSALGLREIIRDSGAIVVIVASENTGDSYIAGAPRKGYGRANLVMTMSRRGKAFPLFFGRLFKAMFEGETMPIAWVHLAPQVPDAEHPDAPDTIFAAEAGQVTFR